jgi:hypothetical protein
MMIHIYQNNGQVKGHTPCQDISKRINLGEQIASLKPVTTQHNHWFSQWAPGSATTRRHAWLRGMQAMLSRHADHPFGMSARDAPQIEQAGLNFAHRRTPEC